MDGPGLWPMWPHMARASRSPAAGDCVPGAWGEQRACHFTGYRDEDGQSLPTRAASQPQPLGLGVAGCWDATTHPHGSSRAPDGPRELTCVTRLSTLRGLILHRWGPEAQWAEWPVNTSRERP